MEIKPPINNCFSLQNADEYLCAVYHYTVSHKIMTVVVSHPATDEIFYLEFNHVIYFSGPTYWKGAEFNTHSTSEALNLLRSVEHQFETVPDEILRNYMLFSVNTPQGEVKILSAGVTIKDTLQ